MAATSAVNPEPETPVGFEFGFPTIKGGAPIGQKGDEMGTLAVVGFDAKNPSIQLLLTCAHVAFGKSMAAVGPVLHPPSGSLSEVLGTPDKNGMSEKLDGDQMDCATIRMSLPRPTLPGAIWSFQGVTVESTVKRGPSMVGKEVTKYGARTGKSKGKIVCHEFEWESVSLGHTFADQYKVEFSDPARPFVAEGDSGSLVVLESGTGLAAVGIIIGMHTDKDGKNFGVVSAIEPILKKLGIKITRN